MLYTVKMKKKVYLSMSAYTFIPTVLIYSFIAALSPEFDIPPLFFKLMKRSDCRN